VIAELLGAHLKTRDTKVLVEILDRVLASGGPAR
jgi:hypothetical protein